MPYTEPKEFTDFQIQKLEVFKAKHKFDPNLVSPKRFSEKLLCRILFDEDPYYQLYAKKLMAPYFLLSRLPAKLQFANRLKVRSRITPEEFEDLPDAFVIKSSFGSGLNEIVRNKTDLDIPAICNYFNKSVAEKRNAQGKTDPDNCIIFEEFLGEPDGKAPDDYKFHCFSNGRSKPHLFLQIDSDRFGEHRQSFYDQNFNRLDLGIGKSAQHTETLPRPVQFEDLLDVAQQLCIGFDYIRVDLYYFEGSIYFGELTPFHQGGNGVVSTKSWDDKLGSLWDQRFPSFQKGPDL